MGPMDFRDDQSLIEHGGGLARALVQPSGLAHGNGAVVGDRDGDLDVVDVDRQRRSLARLP